MAYIRVDCRNFVAPFSHLNGTRLHSISFLSYLRAVLTVGFQRLSALPLAGWSGLVHRFGIGIATTAYLRKSNGGLELSDFWDTLDGSEKGAATYWFGMVFAKIVAERELQVPWLAHVDAMHKTGGLTSTSGTAERGDMVGRDRAGNWHVVEAKGRSNSYAQKIVKDAKRQASRIMTVQRHTPATTCACISRVDTSPISVLLDDPANESQYGDEWDTTDDVFFYAYYRGVIEYITMFKEPRLREIEGRQFITAPLSPLLSPSIMPRLSIGLLDTIVQNPAAGVAEESPISDVETAVVGADGIAIFNVEPNAGE